MQFQRKVTPFLYIAGRIMRQRGVILDIFKGRHRGLPHAAHATPHWMIVARFYTIMASRVAQRPYLCIQIQGKEAPTRTARC